MSYFLHNIYSVVKYSPLRYGAVEPTTVRIPIEALEDPPSFEVATVELFGPFQVGIFSGIAMWIWDLNHGSLFLLTIVSFVCFCLEIWWELITVIIFVWLI